MSSLTEDGHIIIYTIYTLLIYVLLPASQKSCFCSSLMVCVFVRKTTVLIFMKLGGTQIIFHFHR